MNVMPLPSQKLWPKKNIFFVKRLFLELLLSAGWTLDFIWNLKKRYQKNVKRAIECSFAHDCSSSSFWVMHQFVEKCWNMPNLTFDDLWWPDLWPDLKNGQISLVIIFWRSFECRLPRVSLYGSGAELQRGALKSLPPSGVENIDTQQGAG